MVITFHIYHSIVISLYLPFLTGPLLLVNLEREKLEDDLRKIVLRISHLEEQQKKQQKQLEDWRAEVNACREELKELNMYYQLTNAQTWLEALSAAGVRFTLVTNNFNATLALLGDIEKDLSQLLEKKREQEERLGKLCNNKGRKKKA
jgi:peptidoglycan hydrolase CwlO-like protein